MSERELRKCWSKEAPQFIFTCSKSTIETPEKGSKLTIKTPERRN